MLINVLSVIVLAAVLVMAGAWLMGNTAVTNRGTRTRSLMYASAIGLLAVLFAATEDWLLAAALGVWSVLEFTMVLAPDLPTKLRGKGEKS